MIEHDAESLAEQIVLLGLLSREQVRQARAEAENGSAEALFRVLFRKSQLTSWQKDRLLKGDSEGFVYGNAKVLFHIAEGTFARVYRGSKMPGNHSVAIKVLRQRFSSDPAAIERFNKEAEAGQKLVHPNIVRIYEYGEDDKRHYMIMEFVEGQNLRDFLKIRTRLTEAEAMPLMLGLAHALKYSLDQGITHRDIKGTNILVSSTGAAKLVDFGLATIEGDEQKMAAAHGERTVDYSALERTCGSPKGDPRSDIYFLGCTFYQMLTGQLPLPEVESKDPLAKMLKRSFGAIKPLSEMRHAPSEGLSRIIERMMKVDLRSRYGAMKEVVDDLEAYRKSTVEASGAAPSTKKTVICVEFQSDIQEAFRKTLGGMGYRALLMSDPEVAVEKFANDPPDLLIFDADGLGSEGIEHFLQMHEKAKERQLQLSALVLLGTKQGNLIHQLPEDDRLVVLSKPVRMKDVQDAIMLLAPEDAA